MTAQPPWIYGIRSIANNIAQAFFAVTHNSFALLGLAVTTVVLALALQPDIRHEGEVHLMNWLQNRHGTSSYGLDIEAVERATASDPQELPKQQAAVAYWLSKKYNVAPEPLSTLVAEAYGSGKRSKLDPTLILAVMAVESGFNPFAQSHVGAQGLMQVMTKVHSDKYEGFGGKLAAFDPVSNLRVGVKVLKDCITRAGSIEGGLKLYVGAANMEADGGYAVKVLTEHARLQNVAAGKAVPIFSPMPVKAPATPSAETAPEAENVASLRLY